MKATMKVEFADDQLTKPSARRSGATSSWNESVKAGAAWFYFAEQTEPVRRRVALKVIKLGMDTRQVGTRARGGTASNKPVSV
jgi:hypothetical protein